ncbi:hypothetical protein V1512DRAFT_261183 [Lipomyces arxii]|uniref:uncharacterized protein n=1 Tax=Lipomyces arxii TaxID=56418 RepID=UPI0034CF0B03
MTSPRVNSELTNAFQNAVKLSTSPTTSFMPAASPSHFSGSPPQSYFPSLASRRSSMKFPPVKVLKPFATEDIKILLLENVNETAVEILTEQGYQVEFHKTSLGEEELIEKIRDVHAIGIRSKTKLTPKILAEARNLVVVGCFCIGVNQVDIEYAAQHGIAVFNSPFSNSRSVAELVIGEIIALARQFTDRSAELHSGIWSKVSAGCWEIRGKTLGIVGYGHIGAQLSVLAESMGMSVVYYDVMPIMSLGMAKQVTTLNDLLREADFVTLHVPELPETKNLIAAPQFAAMKNGSYLINASRGTVIDIPALIYAMTSGKLAGAAIDVYPNEPAKNGPYFDTALNAWADELRSLKNLILTPHIGGSTEEAQSAIGIEVGQALVRYINEGATIGAVNFPEVSLRSLTLDESNHVRVLYVHQNVPGVLRAVNEIFAEHNIDKQYSDSRGDIAYLMADISNVEVSDIRELYNKLERTPFKIMTRLLY